MVWSSKRDWTPSELDLYQVMYSCMRGDFFMLRNNSRRTCCCRTTCTLVEDGRDT
jgi:hypothetical protein